MEKENYGIGEVKSGGCVSKNSDDTHIFCHGYTYLYLMMYLNMYF